MVKSQTSLHLHLEPSVFSETRLTDEQVELRLNRLLGGVVDSIDMESDPRVTVRVECSSGHRGEEVPRAFFLGDRRREVEEILDYWPGRDHRYFKVRSSDGGLYILRYDAPSGEWEITLFEQR